MTIKEDIDKANALNSWFRSVFMVEDNSVMPKVSGQPFPDMDCMHVEGVSQLLSNLDPQKAGGPNNIPTRFLKNFYQTIDLYFFHQCCLKQIISSNIYCHLNKYNILADQQHGFRSRRSNTDSRKN